MFGLGQRATVTGDPRWATFKQAAEQNCHIKKGAKSVVGVFYKPLEVENEKAKDGKCTIPLLKTFRAFHAPEIEGLAPYKPPATDDAPWMRPEAVSVILSNSGVQVQTGGDRAFYSPQLDFIQLPPDVAFSRPEYWSATAIHELNHATGDPSRMNRDLSGKFGSDAYACEEARVGMAAVFVCNTLNLPTDVENHAAYVSGWLKRLRDDKRELLSCAADAQRIAEFTLAHHPDFRTSPPARPQAHSPAEQSEFLGPH